MLPKIYRLNQRHEFAETIKTGMSRKNGSLIVYFSVITRVDLSARAPEPPKIGFIVSRAVGNSVIRHKVVRRLRAMSVRYLETLHDNERLVIRALPSAGVKNFTSLSNDFGSCLNAVAAKRTQR